ncbi:MAG: type III-A CRISPR-associated protein Csm2 [Bacteroidetes bacterium]|nr:type III-A CRISPR-associated protein Csm2 [Bacteroidota bacterium]
MSEKNTDKSQEVIKYIDNKWPDIMKLLEADNISELDSDTINKALQILEDVVNPDSHSLMQFGLEVITTHQLRNIYSQLRNKRKPQDLLLERPRLAYIAAREKKFAPVAGLIDKMIVHATDKNMSNFKYIMESIVAYHKFYNTDKNT